MDDPIVENNFEKARREAREFYKKIPKTGVWCPLLHDYVVFNRFGLRHLFQSGRHRRSLADQKRRFSLLKFAPEIIADSCAKLIPGDDTPEAKFWHIEGLRDRKTITVVVRQIGNGNKHFFSVYNN
jgi:hypothetical protein